MSRVWGCMSRGCADHPVWLPVIPACLDTELTEFPLRMRDWLKNVLITLYERDEDNNLLTEKQKLKVRGWGGNWEVTLPTEPSTRGKPIQNDLWAPHVKPFSGLPVAHHSPADKVSPASPTTGEEDP